MAKQESSIARPGRSAAATARRRPARSAGDGGAPPPGSFRAKLLRSDGLPKVEPIPPKLRERWGRGTVVIAAPREVDACMRAVRRGAVATLDAIRASLAAAHGATIACPITTGIFANYAAHAAEEARAEGSKDVTPWWRTLRADGELPPKFPGAPQLQRTLLEAEGHTVVARGKRWFVVH